MDTVPKPWNKVSEAAKLLRKDLADGKINPKDYKPKHVYQMRDVFSEYTLQRFGQNLKNVVADYLSAISLGGDAVAHWLETGKVPAGSNGKFKTQTIIIY